jgi:hypothetical protein
MKKWRGVIIILIIGVCSIRWSIASSLLGHTLNDIVIFCTSHVLYVQYTVVAILTYSLFTLAFFYTNKDVGTFISVS